MPVRLRFAFLFPWPWVLSMLAGCASLPPLPERAPSTAFTDTRTTALGRIAEASLAAAEPGESGFRLLPAGDFALDARLALAAHAERSLDVQ
jgi:putative cardiolipin synthase